MDFDSKNIKTTATKSGETYIINGSKNFISNSIESDYVIVTAKTESKSKSEGIRIFIVETNLPGVNYIKQNKLGSHNSDMTEIVLKT